jgi:hypothetical protein
MNYEESVEQLRLLDSNDFAARCRMGEHGVKAAAVWGWGAIAAQAKDATVNYKTFAERTRVIDFYGATISWYHLGSNSIHLNSDDTEDRILVPVRQIDIAEALKLIREGNESLVEAVVTSNTLADLREELPNCTWSRARMAKGLKDRDAAITLLTDTAHMESEAEFIKELKRRKKKRGIKPTGAIVLTKAGYRTVITKEKDG